MQDKNSHIQPQQLRIGKYTAQGRAADPRIQMSHLLLRLRHPDRHQADATRGTVRLMPGQAPELWRYAGGAPGCAFVCSACTETVTVNSCVTCVAGAGASSGARS